MNIVCNHAANHRFTCHIQVSDTYLMSIYSAAVSHRNSFEFFRSTDNSHHASRQEALTASQFKQCGKANPQLNAHPTRISRLSLHQNLNIQQIYSTVSYFQNFIYQRSHTSWDRYSKWSWFHFYKLTKHDLLLFHTKLTAKLKFFLLRQKWNMTNPGQALSKTVTNYSLVHLLFVFIYLFILVMVRLTSDCCHPILIKSIFSHYHEKSYLAIQERHSYAFIADNKLQIN